MQNVQHFDTCSNTMYAYWYVYLHRVQHCRNRLAVCEAECTPHSHAVTVNKKQERPPPPLPSPPPPPPRAV